MIKKYLTDFSNNFNKNYEKYIEVEKDIPIIYDAMNYSMSAGGKRIRPALLRLTADLLGYKADKTDKADKADKSYKGDSLESFEVAIEMIHTYSLIHDDLPAMDNDTLRRGKPTNHIVYGENFAILAGDGLLNKAYEVLFKEVCKKCDPLVCAASEYVARFSGAIGMVGGQALDLYYEKNQANFEIIKEMHRRKTGSLLKAPIIVACIIAEASPQEREHLETYGDAIGLAFQISDDILDFTGEVGIMGKTTGKDLLNEKKTYVTEFGLAKARSMAKEQQKKAKDAIEIFGEKGILLRELADYIVQRDK